MIEVIGKNDFNKNYALRRCLKKNIEIMIITIVRMYDIKLMCDTNILNRISLTSRVF